MLYWIDILHLYQPPTQSKEVVDKVVHESYEKILNLFETYPNLRLTINLSGSLIELLEKYGYQHIINGFRKYAGEGRLELLGSAMYHPILPLLTGKEIERQINLNTAILKKHFKAFFKPRGFYVPEMAYGKNIEKIIKKNGFSWIVLDEIHNKNPVHASVRYTSTGGLGIIFRNTSFSKSFPPESIYTNRGKITGNYLVTAHDGELYGHWHTNDYGYYDKSFTDPAITMLTASEYLHRLTTAETVSLVEANWESTAEELSAHIPYGLWQHPANGIHKKLESLKKYALKILKENQENSHYDRARKHADKGLASCAWWWASERQIGPFSPLAWNPEEIEKGAQALLTAVRSLRNIDEKIYMDAEALFNKVHEAVWQKHWKKHPNG